MRTVEETKARWDETLKHSSGLADLQRAVKFNGPSSPCVAGCRSICWKAFLLFRNAPAPSWSQLLAESRRSYGASREQYLRFIKHPEQLAELSFDPLADDPNSPWDVARQDEQVRVEILQDVQRLPDEPFYHEETVQTMILDILFLYCKLHPGAGGYRQGMHELLAPIVYVVHMDAIDRSAAASVGIEDPVMLDMLDFRYIEQDAYALFANIMQNAQAFYETGEGTESTANSPNTIVEKSRHIHESILTKVDQELADHLKSIEVLPQIFLIRWIRLLFGREFPFEQLLVLWDTIFAFDPTLELIDLICVAMLIRIRWTLLEADYSVALQLLLKYPAPEAPHGPHTFVDDAVYLKNHTNAAGGSTLIMKYTGRQPVPVAIPKQASRPLTPTFQGFGSLRQRTLGARSPLASSARILQQPGGVEALFQSATKNVMERGEKLGINQAVRDAMGEIRRNVQGLQDPRVSRMNRDLFGEDQLGHHAATLAAMERRNKQLAAMLDETVENLRRLASRRLEGDKDEHIQAIEMAAAKAQFVKVYLEDSTLLMPEEDLPPIGTLSISSVSDIRSPTVALDTTQVVTTSSAVDVVRSTLSSPASDQETGPTSPPPKGKENKEDAAHDGDQMDTDAPETASSQPLPKPSTGAEPSDPLSSTTSVPQRPSAPIPTRSTLAQSSFAWMLEPDAVHGSPPNSFPPTPSGGGQGGIGHKKRAPNSASRERNAFLFGEVTSEGSGEVGVSTDEIFGLKPIRKGSGSRSGSLPRVVEDVAKG
ncbi:RabGAP/TBC [Thozetella sp. PMI_491]|nr:RabGAP/TBC [Thozetella sp. PMI_491]